MIKITIPIRAESENKIWSGCHWSKRKEYADFVKLAVFQEINSLKHKQFTDVVDIRVYAYFSKRPQDSENVCSKPFIDALTKQGALGHYILIDDSIKYVRDVTRRSIKSDKDYVEIYIKSVKERKTSIKPQIWKQLLTKEKKSV